MTANELPQDVQSSIWFLQEDELYEKVKPYALAFTPEIDIPRENIRRKEFSVPIKDIRGSIKDPSLQDNGFMVLQLQEKDTDIDWTDERNVKEAHYPQIVRDVENALPGVHCAVLHHQVGLVFPDQSPMLTIVLLLVDSETGSQLSCIIGKELYLRAASTGCTHRYVKNKAKRPCLSFFKS